MSFGLPISTDGTLNANSDSLLATQKAVKTYVDAQAGGGGTSPGGPQWSNLSGSFDLGMGQGALILHGADGNPLSSSNKFTCTLPSKLNPGTYVTLEVTSPPPVLDATEFSGMSMGIVTSAPWGTAMPAFIYAAMNVTEDAVGFFITRNPCASSMAQVYKTSTASSLQYANQFFAFDSTITESDWENTPIIRVGSWALAYGGSDTWYITNVASGVGLGIGQYNESVTFYFPTGQMFADSGSYFQTENGSSFPSGDSGQEYKYWVKNDGTVHVSFYSESFTFNSSSNGCSLRSPFLIATNKPRNPIGNLVLNGTGVNVLSANVPSFGFSPIVTSTYSGGSLVAGSSLTPDDIGNSPTPIFSMSFVGIIEVF